jgi:hypothetical protein
MVRSENSNKKVSNSNLEHEKPDDFFSSPVFGPFKFLIEKQKFIFENYTKSEKKINLLIFLL